MGFNDKILFRSVEKQTKAKTRKKLKKKKKSAINCKPFPLQVINTINAILITWKY